MIVAFKDQSGLAEGFVSWAKEEFTQTNKPIVTEIVAAKRNLRIMLLPFERRLKLFEEMLQRLKRSSLPIEAELAGTSRSRHYYSSAYSMIQCLNSS
jgi:hypothetical protein